MILVKNLERVKILVVTMCEFKKCECKDNKFVTERGKTKTCHINKESKILNTIQVTHVIFLGVNCSCLCVKDNF